MPKRARELSALEVGRLKTDGFYAVGGVSGLYLQIRGAARSWILRATVGSARRDMGLGAFPSVTLAMARERARTARQAIDAGTDPILARETERSALRAAQASAITFSTAATMYIAAKASEWRNEKHHKQWTSTLETYAKPVIGELFVADIQQSHVLAVLEPIWTTKTETATRIRSRIEQVLDWARVRGYRQGDNPARWRGHLDKLLPKPSKVATVSHHQAIEIDAVPAFMESLRSKDSMGAKALEFLVLTAARSGEVRGATWKEIDLEKAIWTIPEQRMKAGKEHRVPLSRPALALLTSLPRLVGSEIIFHGNEGKPLRKVCKSPSPMCLASG